MKSVAEALKLSTKEAHVQTEKSLLLKLKAIKSVDDYIEILSIFHGYFSPIEQLVKRYITTDHISDINKRERASLLVADLGALGAKELPATTAELPAINNFEQAIGAMYVMEGSTLGGQHIVRMLQTIPALHPYNNAMRFFSGYKDETELMWQSFKQQLDEVVTTEFALNVVISSAIETFDKMNKWILKGTNDRKYAY